jgi:hypothetical protein
MAKRLPALAAALAASVTASSASAALPHTTLQESLRISDVSASPRLPRAGAELVVSGRVQFGGGLGSIRCTVRVAGTRYRAIRLTWENSVARCAFVVPRSARGKRLTVTLQARLGGSAVRQTLGFRVS